MYTDPSYRATVNLQLEKRDLVNLLCTNLLKLRGEWVGPLRLHPPGITSLLSYPFSIFQPNDKTFQGVPRHDTIVANTLSSFSWPQEVCNGSFKAWQLDYLISLNKCQQTLYLSKVDSANLDPATPSTANRILSLH